MKKEAHERLDDILEAKEMWYYPLVITVIVESPAVRTATKTRRQNDNNTS